MPFLKQEFVDCLNELGLSQVEAAKLLSVNPRTLNRWTENPNEVSGPAEQALRAWLRLQRYNLPWRPDGFSIAENDSSLPEQIARLRNHCISLDDILNKVGKRGGTKLPWQIDLKRGTAKLETIEVGFYKLPNGGFTPAVYRRIDQQPNIECDQVLLEEAIFAIHQALSKERVTN